VVKERVAKAVCYDSYARKRVRPARVIKAGGVVAPMIYGASCKSGCALERGINTRLVFMIAFA